MTWYTRCTERFASGHSGQAITGFMCVASFMASDAMCVGNHLLGALCVPMPRLPGTIDLNFLETWISYPCKPAVNDGSPSTCCEAARSFLFHPERTPFLAVPVLMKHNRVSFRGSSGRPSRVDDARVSQKEVRFGQVCLSSKLAGTHG